MNIRNKFVKGYLAWFYVSTSKLPDYFRTCVIKTVYPHWESSYIHSQPRKPLNLCNCSEILPDLPGGGKWIRSIHKYVSNRKYLVGRSGFYCIRLFKCYPRAIIILPRRRNPQWAPTPGTVEIENERSFHTAGKADRRKAQSPAGTPAPAARVSVPFIADLNFADWAYFSFYVNVYFMPRTWYFIIFFILSGYKSIEHVSRLGTYVIWSCMGILFS